MNAKELSTGLLEHPNFKIRDGMLVKDGTLDLEHPSTLGWLFCMMMRMAPRTVIRANRIKLKTVRMDGKMRESIVEIERDDDGNRMFGAAIASAILLMWENNWDMVFDDPLSAHSLGAAFLALEHY